MEAVLEKPECCGTDCVKSEIECRLEKFANVVNESDMLEIDGVLYKGDMYEGAEIKEDCIKVINKKHENASLVTIEALLTQDVGDVIEALETGVINKLHGVTRIVGLT